MEILLRHGATQANSPGQEVIRGQGDYRLIDRGRAEAQSAADRLAALRDQGVPMTALYTDDLSRAHETASIVGQRLNLPLIVTPILRTRALGDFEGQPVDQAADQINQLGMDGMPPGRNAESRRQFRARWLSFLTAIRQQGRQDAPIFVTHGQNFREAQLWTAHGWGLPDQEGKEGLPGGVGTRHGGLALMAPGRFEVVDPKPTGTGLS